jgi:GLPGLI family protein
MKRVIVLFLITSYCSNANAQNVNLSFGKIVYEKRTNQFRQLEATNTIDNPFLEEMKKGASKIISDEFELLFTKENTFYKLKETNSENKYFTIPPPSEEATVLKNLKNNSISNEKLVFGKTFLIQDSLQHYDWKITDEVRTVCGFECRKAVAKIFDSVYVVAFYTNQIQISSGPESFSGLPGMIMELAIPRLYTTWVAKTIESAKPPQDDQFKIKQKGEKVNFHQYWNALNKLSVNLPAEAKSILWSLDL